jgi:hypothetical protein
MAQFPRRLPFLGYHRVIAGLISDRPSIRRRIARSYSEVVLDILAKKRRKISAFLGIGSQLHLILRTFLTSNKINKGDLHFSSNILLL